MSEPEDSKISVSFSQGGGSVSNMRGQTVRSDPRVEIRVEWEPGFEDVALFSLMESIKRVRDQIAHASGRRPFDE